MNTSWRNASLVASAAVVLALTTACGQEGGSSAASQNVGATAPVTGGITGGITGVGAGAGTGAGAGASASPGTGAQGGTAGELAVTVNAELGKILTDGSGKTLYRFDQDTAEPPKSNCDGQCATAWPPVPADDVSAADGIDKSLLGEVTRTDGSKQLTIGGWPAYYYAKDANAGDISGQGVNNKWFAMAPDGKKATKAAELPGLSVRNDPNLGDIVVDAKGMTVYRFMKDSQWPMKTACTGACLDKWPVVGPVDAKNTEGIDLQGSTANRGYVVFKRPDGLKQQTIDCVPLYTFAGDKAPGDINGQGVGGAWFAVGPDGKPVGAPGQN
ncbi:MULTISPECIES: SCO0930 family lipoprotein [unclassified Streptomyces]|uniref:SCO0930 family lipoprotein n=1 Tax=unclassified Streptomyces TaxID=2593676 RepID=UPI003D75527A